MKLTYGHPGSYRCYSCDLVLHEPFFCRSGIERFAAAFAYVGLAIEHPEFQREMRL